MKEFLRLIFVSLSCIVLGESLLASSQAMVRKDIEFDEIGDVYKKVCLSQESSDSEVLEAPFIFENTTSSVSSAASTEFLLSAVDIGLFQYIDALLARGKEHLVGTPTVSQNFNKAAQCFTKVAAYGNADASYELGLLYLNGQGVDKNLDKALELFTTAAQLDYKEAYECINSIGVCFGNGAGVAQDYKKAVSCFLQAIGGKVPEAYHNLGALYLNGQGVDKNLDKALELFTQSADLGSQDACAIVYHCFAKGIRVQKDEKRAAAYLKKLAETLGEQEAKKRVNERIHNFLFEDPKINCVGEMSVCPICTNKFVQGGTITILVCGFQVLHIFCKDCFDRWRTTCEEKNRSLTCPYCRSTNVPVFQGHAF